MFTFYIDSFVDAEFSVVLLFHAAQVESLGDILEEGLIDYLSEQVFSYNFKNVMTMRAGSDGVQGFLEGGGP